MQEFGKPALRQQHRLGEVLVGQAENSLHLRLDLVWSLGERLDARREQASQRRARWDLRIEPLKPRLLGVNKAFLVAGRRPDPPVPPAGGLQDQADPAAVAPGCEGRTRA